MPPATAPSTPLRSDAIEGRRRSAAAEWLIAAGGFTALAVVLTWPWAKAMWRGCATGDAVQFVWDAWWVEKRLLALDNPWWTGHLYAPEGTYLTAHPLETLLMVLVRRSPRSRGR